MKLIDEAISLLGNANEPLANAFFKAQVIAHRLGDDDFAKWVKSEIQGYKPEDELPAYREVWLTPHGDVENLVKRYSNYVLPTGGMPKDVRQKFLVSRISQSIAVVEEFSKKDQNLVVNLPPALYQYLRKGIDASFSITSAWGTPPAGCFTQILHEARSRLLDLLLTLSDVIQDEGQIDAQTAPVIKEVNGMFKGAVFGDGANINLAIGQGSQASHNRTTVVKSDIDSLARELADNKVSEDDISLLKVAIEEDSAQEQKGIGDKVRAWLGSMISKAGTPAWEVPAQIGAGVLTDAISKYYGLS